jgi:tRNA-dihydrouridine synthase
MGCPVDKALRHNYGVALMGDPDYAAQVVAMTVRNSSVPISVKLRAGQQNDFSFLEDFVGGLVNAGASWITLHPRTPEQKRRGQADWSQIKKLKQSISVPVIGNGDIQTDEDVLRMLSETGCDMVMAGRALASRPWMLWQVGERLGLANPIGKTGSAPRTREEEGAEYGRAVNRLIDYLRQYFSPDLALRKLRFYVRTTSVWLPFGHTLVSISAKAKTLDEAQDLFAQFFTQTIEMSPRTELRQ